MSCVAVGRCVCAGFNLVFSSMFKCLCTCMFMFESNRRVLFAVHEYETLSHQRSVCLPRLD